MAAKLEPKFLPGQTVRLRCGGPSMTVLYRSEKPIERMQDNPFHIPPDTFIYSVAYVHERQGLEQIVLPEHALISLQ